MNLKDCDDCLYQFCIAYYLACIIIVWKLFITIIEWLVDISLKQIKDKT